MSKFNIHTGSVYPGLQLNLKDYGSKTLVNTQKEVHEFTFGIILTRDLGNLAAKLALYSFCKELEKITPNINAKELTKWWR